MRKALVLALLACCILGVGATADAELIYVIAGGTTLQSFESATPLTSTSVTVTGLQAGESILGIDLRPATGQLYALGSTSRLYTINPATGAATQVGTSGAFSLSGNAFGFDFNPTVDRIRIVSDAGQNIRLNPNDGTLTGTDTTLSYGPSDPNLKVTPEDVAAAYTSNFAGASSTTLFGIDSNLDILVRQGSVDGSPVSPNTGQLFTVGPLGVNGNGLVGFDVSGVTGTAYATLCSGLACSFYTINLSTGAATLVANLTQQTPINALTVGAQGPTPTPTATATATATPTATPTATSTPTVPGGGGEPTVDVPTLSGWAMLALGLVLAATGWLFLRGGSGSAS